MAKKTSSDSGKPKKNKKKTSKKSGPNAVATKHKVPAANPFETIWSRQKFNILGKKRKGEQRRIGLSRSLAIEKRKKTLLKEYEQSGKSSVFVDNRIGEHNEDLGEFDKGIMRSQLERKSKKSKYNLSDVEEEELEIQHGLFPENDDFEDELPFDEDEDDSIPENGEKSAILGRLKSSAGDTSQQADLNGNENRQRTKKEVMEEIIFKSKFFKAEKAKEKEENEQLVEQLDHDFTSLVQSESLIALTQPSKIHALRALINNPTSNAEAKKEISVQNKAATQHEKPDFYDKLVSEMALDMRARPSDRTKTPEEIAQEEKERLEQLEEERQKRMVAADGSSDDDDDGPDDDNNQLESSNVEEIQTKVGWIGNVLRDDADDDRQDAAFTEESEDEEDSEEEETDEDDESDKAHSLKDWEQSDDDELGTDVEDDEEDMESEEKKQGNQGSQMRTGNVESVKESSKLHTLQIGELPYTIEAPKSLEEFTSLLENRPDDQIVEAIRRIRAFNAINLAAENKRKMQVFYGVLLQYFAILANKKLLNFKLLNLLVKPLMEMSAEIPYFAAICARERLLRIRTQFVEDVKSIGKSSWPSRKTIFLLRLWSMIFPCSDFRHPVMTPATLLICEYLTRCQITSGRDILIGSFLCSLMLSIVKQSRKFCPEVLTFIRTVLASASDKTDGTPADHQLNHLMEIKVLEPLLCIKSPVKEINSLNFLMLMELPDNSRQFSSDDFRAGVLAAITEALKGFVNIYEGYNSFPEIFLPISKLLSKLADQDHMPETLQISLRDVLQLIEKKTEEHHTFRKPLQMRKKKPVPVKMLAPKFEENFVKGRDYDPDRERAERKKLKKQVNRERKSAARELRKDNHFLFGVKDKEKRLLEEERAEKYGKARAFLQEQEHQFKSGQLGKGNKRRRK
ncbi:OLC1v1032571C1 [Oldenlandia corymbosa var. corymbosa]|uniref:OLC1v1032571C1 n=1 Tax=Oldenlandia corymbosa var. corymbosa TaxID=529605 RepID=A0AAV1CL51_OLDCO|nr:OLC1v1032571C1 [Oldenlandia corymbosa var. corymbosa]